MPNAQLKQLSLRPNREGIHTLRQKTVRFGESAASLNQNSRQSPPDLRGVFSYENVRHLPP
ncbi:MAG: hypothetical protein F6J93_10455 [Oscillatoria sp. SIO1A7]|nr:hypothetical protein [Oscillatoria sp. SIO1A7]